MENFNMQILRKISFLYFAVIILYITIFLLFCQWFLQNFFKKFCLIHLAQHKICISVFSVMSFTVCIGDANKHYSGVIKFVLPQKPVNGFWRYLLPGSCREITVAN
jgi:hypothetical protein